MKAKVTSYQGYLILEAVDHIFEGGVPIDTLQTACTLVDTKSNLGISEEALSLLESVPVANEPVGDFVWVTTEDGKKVFSWVGGYRHILGPGCVAAQGTQVFRDHCQIIPNEVPEGAKRVIHEEWAA